MADYRIQLKDKEGNRQFPVTTTQSIVDSEGRSLEEILANLGDGGGSGNGGGFEVRTVYPTKQTVLEEETFDITDEERAYNMETLSKTLSGKTVFCKVGEAILFPTISMSGAVTEATYSTVVVLGGSLASYNLTITSDGDAEVAIAEVTTGGGGGSIDPEMSDTSENAVQNKVVKKYIDSSTTKKILNLNGTDSYLTIQSKIEALNLDTADIMSRVYIQDILGEDGPIAASIELFSYLPNDFVLIRYSDYTGRYSLYATANDQVVTRIRYEGGYVYLGESLNNAQILHNQSIFPSSGRDKYVLHSKFYVKWVDDTSKVSFPVSTQRQYDTDIQVPTYYDCEVFHNGVLETWRISSVGTVQRITS